MIIYFSLWLADEFVETLTKLTQVFIQLDQLRIIRWS